MSLNRTTLVALAALFSSVLTSAAFAGCCAWGPPAPVFYEPPAIYAARGCGGCGAPVVTYVQPVEVVPAAPVAVGCGGCGGPVVYAAPLVEPVPLAPAPIYVVNQGPDYSGPDFMVPFHTYAPGVAYAPPAEYPYVYGGYRRYHRYWGGHFGYHRRWHSWHHYARRWR